MKDLPPEHQRRMTETVKVLLGTFILGTIALAMILSLPDWQWVIDYGYQR